MIHVTCIVRRASRNAAEEDRRKARRASAIMTEQTQNVLTCSFTQQIYIENLLHARQVPGPPAYVSEQWRLHALKKQ